MTAIAPTLETERLVLRMPQAGDFEAWAAFSADPEAMEHLGGVQSRSVAWRSICTMTGAWHIRGFSMFSVIEKATGQWVGRMGPWQPEGWPGTEVGWGIVRDRWGRGYATEAAVVVMDYVVDRLGWREIIHTIVPDNGKSQSVARKLGSTILRQATLPAPLDHVVTDVWGQTRDQWVARRSEPR